MKITRLVELTFWYKVQEALGQQRLKETATSADFLTYTLKYNSIIYSSPITVYINGITQNSSFYTVNYTQGLITLKNKITSSDIVQVDYSYCPINMYDESTNPTSKDFKYPAVAVYEQKRNDVPYELGNAKRMLEPTWVFDIWAERGGERNDISDIIMELLEENNIPIIDYNQGFPVNADGSLNPSFNYTSQTIGYITTNSINYLKGGSYDSGEQPKFLTEIYADLEIYI